MARYLLTGLSTPPRCFSLGLAHSQKRYPPLVLSFAQKRLCEIPHSAAYRVIILQHVPHKQTQKSFAILPPQVPREMKSISAGPLKVRGTSRASQWYQEINFEIKIEGVLWGGTSAERSWHDIFLSRHEFSHEKASENFPDIFEPLFCGSEKSRQIHAKFPANVPPKYQKNSPTSICRSTGRSILGISKINLFS